MDATKLDACVTKVDALAKRMDDRMDANKAFLRGETIAQLKESLRFLKQDLKEETDSGEVKEIQKEIAELEKEINSR